MAILGELEQRIMDTLWQQRTPVSVRFVHESLLSERELAYTTVMTVLDRLAKKGLVDRERDGRAWLYTAGTSHARLVSDSLAEVLQQAGSHRSEVLRQFTDALTEQDRATLREALRS